MPKEHQQKMRDMLSIMGGMKPVLHGPWGDELAEAVTPDVLVDSDGSKDGARDGLVAVDCVGGGGG
jgi:hypothetical protein